MSTTLPLLPAQGSAPSSVGVDTHCPYCALQCGMHLARAEGSALEVTAREFPTNRGGMCQKGWTAAELLASPDRLTTPLMRTSRDAPLLHVSWEVALDRVAAEFRRIQTAHGLDAVAVFGGGGLTNEKAYMLGKFARVALRTKNIDYNGRFCMSSAAAAGIRAFGLDRGMPFPIEDVAAAEVVLLVGGNSAETMPPFVRHLEGEGRSLIVIDPRVTSTARKARLHLQPTPGTDLALALGMLHVALVENLVDEAYVSARTAGWDEVARGAAAYWPERVERMSGVPASSIRQAAHLLAHASTAIILTGRGAEQHSNGTDTVTGWINLALALGLPGRPGSGYGCLTGQGNGQGGREHGQKADQLPGYRKIDDPAAREHVAAVWGVPAESLPGKGISAYELLDALGRADGPKALFLAGSNPLVSAPNARSVSDRIDALEFLVVSDFVLSETAAQADVVLPTTQWAEEEGTMTNLEGRVILRRQARPAPGSVRSDLEILSDLARLLEAPVDFERRPRVVFDELRRATAGGPADYSGITYERIAREDGVFWPCRSEEDPGERRMFLDSFATPDGLARFIAVEHRAPAEDVDSDYPYYLTTGRVLHHYQSGAQTRRIAPLRKASPGPFVEMSHTLAEQLGIEAGDEVVVTSRRGVASAPVRLSDDIRADTVFMPFHWAGKGRANSLTSDALDPISRMPEFKVCAVRVERVAG